MTERIQVCEICGERPGYTNSRYYRDDEDDEGLWVCIVCEQYAFDYLCPCGCNGGETCVYHDWESEGVAPC